MISGRMNKDKEEKMMVKRKRLIKICTYILMLGVMICTAGCSLRSHKRENTQKQTEKTDDDNGQGKTEKADNEQEQGLETADIEYDFGDEIVEYSCSYINVSPDKIVRDFIKEPYDELETKTEEDDEFVIKYYTGKDRSYNVAYSKDKRSFSLYREDNKSKKIKKTDVSDADKIAEEYIKKLGYDVTLKKERVDRVDEYEIIVGYGFSKEGNYIIGNRNYEPYFFSGWATLKVENGEAISFYVVNVPGELTRENVIKRTDLIDENEMLNSIASSPKYSFFGENNLAKKVSIAYQPETQKNGKIKLKPLFQVFFNKNTENEIMNDAMLIDPKSGIVLD